MHGHDTDSEDLGGGRASSGSRPDEGPDTGADCQEALDTLYHFLDGELNEERRYQIQIHLDRCSSCLEAFDFEAELKIVVAQRCREKVPDSLRLRVASALADASNTFPDPLRGAGTSMGDPRP